MRMDGDAERQVENTLAVVTDEELVVTEVGMYLGDAVTAHVGGEQNGKVQIDQPAMFQCMPGDARHGEHAQGHPGYHQQQFCLANGQP